jgi:signal transduction histidine kinase
LRRVAADREAIIAIVGHELRGPLAAAHAAAGLITEQIEGTDRGDVDNLLVLLDRQLSRLRRLVDMFLTAQRLEGGSLRVQSRRNAFNSAIQQVVSDGAFENVSVQVGEDVHVLSDPDHLAQVLWNLISNAVRHGEPPVNVEARREDDTIALLVRDAGPGVPTELRPHLFERYSRGTASAGTGLGLAIVRGLALANGADIAYTHALEIGPAFVLRLPAAAGSDDGP